MFDSNHFKPGGPLRICAFIAGLLLCNFSEADDLSRTLQQRLELQSAEIDLIKAQLQLQQWKRNQLDELYNKGFASWLEVRRHQLAVDSIAVRLESALEFQSFLSDVQIEQQSAIDSHAPVFCERHASPVKVFLPGSIRMIGWIEGQTSIKSTDATAHEIELDPFRERLAKAQKRFDETNKLQSVPANWLEKASLDLNLAEKEFEYVKALKHLPVLSNIAEASQTLSIDDIKNVVSANDRVELKLATARVAKAEAASVAKIDCAKILLARQQRRLDALTRLHTEGYATANELQSVSEQVSRIQLDLSRLMEMQHTLANASSEYDDADDSPSDVTCTSVSAWPEFVLCDREFAWHLIDLRREFYNELSLAQIARLRSGMLQDVALRLKSAAEHGTPDSDLGSVLNEGQRNEILAYETEIELAVASAVAADEKRRILIHEEDRFIQQVIAQHDVARNQMVSPNTLFFGALGFPNWFHPTGAIFSSGTSDLVPRYNYLESARINVLGQASSLVYSQSNRGFIGSNCLLDSGDRFKLQPMQSMWLSSESGRCYSSARGLQVEPEWMKYLRCNVDRNDDSVVPYPLPSVVDDLKRGNQYGRYGYRSYGIYSAYPNGILRGELRSLAPVGQLPWYLPGSPSNLRSDDLRFRH